MLGLDLEEDDPASRAMEMALIASIRDPRHVGTEVGVEIGLDEDPKMGQDDSHRYDKRGDEIPLIREVSSTFSFSFSFSLSLSLSLLSSLSFFSFPFISLFSLWICHD